ncbi:hypothetical protein D3C85_1076920 [compost metagenome]
MAFLRAFRRHGEHGAAGVVGPVLATLTRLGHRLVASQVDAVVHLGLQFGAGVIGRVQRLEAAHRHKVGSALGDPGVACELIAHRLTQPEVRAFVTDEPARTLQHLLAGVEHADALELHDDQAGQDAAPHAGKARGRTVPTDHDGRSLAAYAGRAEAAEVVVVDARREAADLLADPGRQVGVDDGRQPLAGRHPRLPQQDV